MYKNTRYVNGSSAHKIEYNVYETNEKLRNIKQRKKTRKLKVRQLLLISALSVLMGFVIYRYNYIAELNYKMDHVKKQYNAVEDQNNLMKVKIEKNLNLNSIRSEAINKIGMQNPNQDQKVYISVQTNDFAMASTSSSQPEHDKGILSKIVEKVQALLGLL